MGNSMIDMAKISLIGRFGHIIKWHGRDVEDESLQKRIKSSGIPAASRFEMPDAEVQKMLKWALHKASDRIQNGVQKWNEDKQCLILKASGCGSIFRRRGHDWKQGPIRCDYFCIVWANKFDRDYNILDVNFVTAYPVADPQDVWMPVKKPQRCGPR